MRYTEIAIAQPFENAPQINVSAIIGASPKKPILIYIAATGERPMSYSAENLPKGLTVDGAIISGSIAEEGNYEIILKAKNALGECEKRVTLEIKQDNFLVTPLMGFTSWNAYGFESVSAEAIEHSAKRMKELGLSEYGYKYVNIDSGWQGEYGGSFDAVMPNEKFPDMKGLCDRLHKMGFKCGIYSTPMLTAFGCSMSRIPLPPGCTQGDPDPRFADERGGIGVIHKEKNNAQQWAEWGFDYLKYDWRPSDPINAELMRKELAATNRDFGYSVTVRARPEYHTYWEKYCSSYRCNPDTEFDWDNLMTIYRTYFDFIPYINKGHYFDLDMLDIGECELFKLLKFNQRSYFGLTEDEQLIEYSMRAFLNSPIQISSKLDNVSEFELSMYCNDEIIAINQDCAFSTAIPLMIIEKDGSIVHVFKKKLADGSYALAVFNLGKSSETVSIYLDELSAVRDVWAKKDLYSTSVLKLNTKPHTVRIFKISHV